MNTSFLFDDITSIGSVRQDFEPGLDDLIGASTAKSLALIGRLKQLCNSPVLLPGKSDEKEELESTANTAIKNALVLLPESAQIDDMTLSGISELCFQDCRYAYGSCIR
jgi:hypothetical protein